jgi:hypothetical protein
VAQVARVARAFADAGVMVHAYLMYGFPTQTEAETVDSLEMVRQLFAAGAVHSAFWHRFTLTRHSPIAAAPERYRVRVVGPTAGPFANNDLVHEDPTGGHHERFAEGLRRALLHYMHGRGLDEDVRRWFADEGSAKRRRRLAPTSVAPDFIARAIADRRGEPARANARLVWIGGPVEPARDGRRTGVLVTGRNAGRFIAAPPRIARWIAAAVEEARPAAGARRSRPTLAVLSARFPDGEGAFARYTRGAAWRSLLELGLLRLP